MPQTFQSMKSQKYSLIVFAKLFIIFLYCLVMKGNDYPYLSNNEPIL